MSEIAQNIYARLQAHLKRTELVLAQLDRGLDSIEATVETAANSTSTLRARFEFVLCVFSTAPLDKITACIGGGGLVFAVLASPAKLVAAATIRAKSITGAQVLARSQTTARVRYTDGSEAEIANPAKAIAMVALFWVGA
jgi:hypothetical protein